MALQPFVGTWPLFSFLILYTVGRTPWTGDQHFARPLPTHRTTQTQNKRKQTATPPNVRLIGNCTEEKFCVNMFEGRAIAQAVSRRLPTAAAWVRAQIRYEGFVVDKMTLGVGFLRVLRFPLPILIPPTVPHSSSIIWGWYNRPISGRCTKWTQSHPTPRN
jgi:hypothetical protein